jgi:predicted oxidoreductase
VGQAIHSIVAKGVFKREDIWVSAFNLMSLPLPLFLHKYLVWVGSVVTMASEFILGALDLQIQSEFSPYNPTKNASFFPYDVSGNINFQVSGSIACSLANFSTPPAYIDAILLHAPYPSLSDTLTAYKALELYVPSQIKHLGLSNIDVATLRAVYDAARIKPVIVQNRFTADIASIPNPEMPPGVNTPEDKYDAAVRAWGSPNLLGSELVKSMAKELGVDSEVALRAGVQGLSDNVSTLVGTGKEERIESIVAGMRNVDEWKREDRNREKWDAWMLVLNELLLEEP